MSMAYSGITSILAQDSPTASDGGGGAGMVHCNRMVDFRDAIQKHKGLGAAAQKKAGKAIHGKMGEEHDRFLLTVLGLLDSGDIDVTDARSLLRQKVYDKLPQEWKDQTDLALMNIAHLLEDIVEFRLSKLTPDESPQLQTMIEHLWQMKQRIESKGKGFDVFKF